MVVALRDKHISEPVCGVQETENNAIATLRVPSEFSWPRCMEIAKHHLDEFQPEWISLQFVSYAYDSRGLVRGLWGKMMPLFAGRKTHIMFHETWLCKESGWGWKHRAIGRLQLLFIRRFVRQANPSVIHTSNATYAALLNRNGIPAIELPLFGNVPVLGSTESNWMTSQLRTVLGSEFRRQDVWLFGLFGSLVPQWPTEPLLTYICSAAKTVGKRPVLLSIGRLGGVGLRVWNRASNEHADRLTFLRLGEQRAERISEYLSFLDFGIAATPRSILGKSGTTVSMLEHGLPVIVNRDDAPGVSSLPRDSDPLLIHCDSNLETRLCAGPKRGPRGSRRVRWREPSCAP